MATTHLSHHRIKNKTTLARDELSKKIESAMEPFMLALSFAWLVLMIIDFTRGLPPFLDKLNTIIWGFFIVDYVAKLILAPEKLKYIRRNLITLAALALPALRLFRIVRVVRLVRLASVGRSLRLLRVLTSLNRGMTALGRTLGRRGFIYILSVTVLVLLAGAAGIYAFENDSGAIPDYGTAVWWTAMILTTMGSDYFPKTPQGRLLCLLLAIYGFAVFGYVTAVVSSYFVERDADNRDASLVGQRDLRALEKQILQLREEISKLQLKN